MDFQVYKKAGEAGRSAHDFLAKIFKGKKYGRNIKALNYQPTILYLFVFAFTRRTAELVVRPQYGKHRNADI
jgi:hypothetical protein